MVDRTTCTQMDEMDLQIVYTSHDLDAIMTWRQALNFAHKQNLPQGSSWRVATEDEKAMVSDLHAGQLSEKARTVYEQQPLWCCAYCNSTDGYKQRLQAVVAHQKDGHPQAVSSTVGSGDIYLHPDGKRQSPFAVFMKAEGSSPIEPQIIRLGSDYILLCPKF
ncbi:hypothetical protein WOLCODRAFT_136168 [Wolfiporia cocos MD-104 SS10]|uniref:Uncharacterized protein n=1 Tax=Wolfiporia cocos (strain MD-104) TaxID=742152 RepID=A0A2H3J8S2_WOLCO|nr:hypothetical protein WOLCODRAFT_136168 [Wolfiporia cocos MD-104 SS10]